MANSTSCDERVEEYKNRPGGTRRFSVRWQRQQAIAGARWSAATTGMPRARQGLASSA